MIPNFALAQVNVPQGGTGQTSFPVGSLIYGQSALRLAATSSPTVGYITASTTATSTLPRISSTGISSTWFCFTGDTCRTTWPSSAIWGSITGTLSDQTDLQNALDLKLTTTAFGTQFFNFFNATTTDALTEGSTNLYWSNTLFDNRLSATTTLPNITTLAGLSLPATQLTDFGTPFWTFFNATTTDALSQGVTNLYYNDSLVNAYIHASTTIPKTYTNNTFTGANTFNGNLTVGTLNGPLQTNAGLVSATTSIGVLYGGTGLTAAPSYGQLLLGNSSSGYTLTATSSLGLSSPWTTSGSNIYRLTGNVGIGTTTPVAPLHISSDTDYGLSLSRATTTGANNFIQFINGTGLTYDAYVGSVSAVVAGETDYTAFTFSGAGTSGVNGTYVQSGTSSGKAAYNKDILFSPLILVWTGDMWIVEDGVGWYYKNSTDSTYPPETGWELFITGDAPAPTLAFNSSPGPSLSHLTFGTNPTPASSATLAERMRITSSGNIGIGTTTPYSKLSVWGGGTGTNRLFELTNSASTTLVSVLNNGTAYFAGNVGVGTTSPYAKLSVVGQTVSAFFTSTTTTASVFPYASTTALTVSGTNGLSLGTLNGPLQGNAGAISATTSVGVLYGGTGLTSYSNGEILYGSDVNVLSKLAIGSAGQVLTVSAGFPTWATPAGGSSLHVDGGGFVYPQTGDYHSAPRYVATSTTASSFLYASTTALSATGQINGGYFTGVSSVTSTLVGSLGIGTTSPYAKLAVVGEVVASHFTATSTTATTSLQNTSLNGAISILGEYFTNLTTYVRSLFTGGAHITITSGSIAVDDDFLLNNGDTGTGTYDFSGATVKQHIYPAFTYPATATTTTASTTVALGPAGTAQTFNTVACFTSSATAGYQFTDGTNLMDFTQASTTVSRFALTTNNTYTLDEKRYVIVGPLTASYLSCSVDITQN